MTKMRRAEIIDRMRRGGEFCAKWSTEQPGIKGGYANPNYEGFGYDDCHVGDVKRMVEKGELVRNNARSFPYIGYELSDELKSN